MQMSNPASTGPTCPPFLRWAGSKRRLVPVLRQFWKSHHKRYVEPFAGSACMFFAIDPPKALLGDINPELIATLNEVKHRVEPVIRFLSTLRQWDKDEYLRLRAMKPKELEKSERAARFIYLNRFCFNGIYRTNRRGEFNVPYSGNRCGSLPHVDTLRACSLRLKTATFVNGDFDKVLEKTRAGDFVYMDPPYAILAKRSFTEYDPKSFNCSDISRLRDWMDALDSRGIDFLVSYAACDEAEILREGFWSANVSVRRNIAGFTASRRLSSEVLISNCPVTL